MSKYRPSPAELRFAEAAADKLIELVEAAVAKKAEPKLALMPSAKSKPAKSKTTP